VSGSTQQCINDASSSKILFFAKICSLETIVALAEKLVIFHKSIVITIFWTAPGTHSESGADNSNPRRSYHVNKCGVALASYSVTEPQISVIPARLASASNVSISSEPTPCPRKIQHRGIILRRSQHTCGVLRSEVAPKKLLAASLRRNIVEMAAGMDPTVPL
jgi:hypothetical protein